MKAHILVADNALEMRNALERRISRIDQFELFLAESPEEAFEILKRYRIHVAVVDVRLEREWDRMDDSGLDVLRYAKDIDPNTARIIITSFPNDRVNKQALNEDLALKIFYVIDEEPQTLIDKINEALNDFVQINFDLLIYPKHFSPWRNLVQETEHLAETLAQDSNLTEKELAIELEELFRKVYWQKEGIRFLKRSQGRSGSGVAMIQQWTSVGDEVPSVIKFNTKANGHIRVEAANYDKFARNMVISTIRTEKMYSTKRLEAIEYLLTGGSDEKDIKEFIDIFNTSNIEQINNVLTFMFTETVKKWHTAKQESTDKTVAQLYIEQWRLTEKIDRMKISINKLMDAQQIIHVLGLRINEKAIIIDAFNLRLPNPLTFGFSNETPWPDANTVKITHGDLNGRNIILGRLPGVWLIDFYHTGFGHALRDFVKLESSIKFEMLKTDHILARCEMEVALAEQNDFAQSLQYKGNYKLTDIEKAVAAVEKIRSLTLQLAPSRMLLEEYHVGLLFNALHLLTWRESSFDPDAATSLHRAHALVAAAIACSKLKKLYANEPFTGQESPMNEFDKQIHELENNLVQAYETLSQIVRAQMTDRNIDNLINQINKLIAEVRTDRTQYNALRKNYRSPADPTFENQLWPYVNRLEDVRRRLETDINPRIQRVADKLHEVAKTQASSATDEKRNLLQDASTQLSKTLQSITEPIAKLGALVKGLESIFNFFQTLGD